MRYFVLRPSERKLNKPVAAAANALSDNGICFNYGRDITCKFGSNCNL